MLYDTECEKLSLMHRKVHTRLVVFLRDYY